MQDHRGRVRHYRDLAARALEKAEAATDEIVRATYFHMAAGWHQLAQEAEKIANGLDNMNGTASDTTQEREGESGTSYREVAS